MINYTGFIMQFAGPPSDIPPGWLNLDGSKMYIQDAPALYKMLLDSGRISASTGDSFLLPTLTTGDNDVYIMRIV